MTQIRDIMTAKVVTVPKKKGLTEVVKIMANTKISSLVITDEERIVGIITERDLIKNVLLPGKSIVKASVDDVMTKDPITISPETDLDEASQIMHSKNIRHLPVVLNGRLVGLVTQTDIVKETHKIHRKNVRFMTYQNIQTFIIILFFIFLIGYLLYRRFFA